MVETASRQTWLQWRMVVVPDVLTVLIFWVVWVFIFRIRAMLVKKGQLKSGIRNWIKWIEIKYYLIIVTKWHWASLVSVPKWKQKNNGHELIGEVLYKIILRELQEIKLPEMALAGYNTSIKQINEKLKRATETKKGQHFDIPGLDIRNKPTCHLIGAFNPAAVLKRRVNDMLSQSPSDPGKFSFLHVSSLLSATCISRCAVYNN